MLPAAWARKVCPFEKPTAKLAVQIIRVDLRVERRIVDIDAQERGTAQDSSATQPFDPRYGKLWELEKLDHSVMSSIGVMSPRPS
jgi:hypothetical protein